MILHAQAISVPGKQNAVQALGEEIGNVHVR